MILLGRRRDSLGKTTPHIGMASVPASELVEPGTDREPSIQNMIFATSCMLKASPGPIPGAPLKSPIVSLTKPVDV